VKGPEQIGQINVYAQTENIKSAMGPYCRQYQSTVCFFSPPLAYGPTKMCLVMFRHILVLPRHKFCSYNTLWACKKAFALLFMKMMHNFLNALKLHAA
jgi:hypothetical protein